MSIIKYKLHVKLHVKNKGSKKVSAYYDLSCIILLIAFSADLPVALQLKNMIKSLETQCIVQSQHTTD